MTNSMKSFRILVAAAAAITMLFTGCKKDVFTGIDESKAPVRGLTYDADNSSLTSIALYWDVKDAINAGATSFSAQLATKEDFSDVDMYNSSVGQTIQASADLNDAVTFSGLKEYTRYYVRVRANYPRSIYSPWTVLESNGSVACVSVGHGIVVMDFSAPKNLELTALSYSRIDAGWDLVGPAEGYEVEYKNSAAAEWIPVYKGANAAAAVENTDAETSYDVRVRAYRTVEGTVEYTDYSTATITTPAKPSFEPQIKTAEQLETFFTEIAALAGPTDAYTLEVDIDAQGASMPRIEMFAASFDGKGHVIKNIKFADGIVGTLTGTFKNTSFSAIELGNAIIGTAEASATVEGINVDAKSSITFPEPDAAANYGTIVNTSAAPITNCKVECAYTQTFAAFPKASINFGGIVGYTTALVKDCNNTGARSVTVDAPASGAYHTMAGIVGYFTGEADKVMVQNCHNTGDIAVQYQTACYFYTAGVAGGTNTVKQADNAPVNQGTIDGCSNSGAISMHYVAGGSGAYPVMGGVAAAVDGKLTNCTNNGPLSAVCDSESATWTCQAIGGVAGVVTFGANNCVNQKDGKISVKALVAGGTAGARGAGNIETSTWAGVIAKAGPYDPDASVVFEKCVNEADIELVANSTTGTPNHHAGAVFAYTTGTVKDCHNKGSFKVTSPVAYIRIGGITGGTKCDVIGCTNSGKLTADMDCLPAGSSVLGTGKFAAYVGGIVGDTYKAASAINVTDCSNSGVICADLSKESIESIYSSLLSGIVACCKGGVEPVITGCKNTGSFDFKGTCSYKSDDLLGGTYQTKY